MRVCRDMHLYLHVQRPEESFEYLFLPISALFLLQQGLSLTLKLVFFFFFFKRMSFPIVQFYPLIQSSTNRVSRQGESEDTWKAFALLL